MRIALRVFTLLCALACASSVLSGPTTDSVAFQGRLTDSGDNPVPDGTTDLTLSLWSDSVGGTMLYSEVRSVVTKNGLYTTCLGCDNASFFDVFTDAPIYLEIQLGGSPPMTPRTALRYTPRALLSARIRGDVYTENGLIRARYNLGSSGQDGVEVLADDTSSGIRVACCLGSSGEDGVEIKSLGSEKRVRVGNIGSSGEDGVDITADAASSQVHVRGIGSSGEDGVSMTDDGVLSTLEVARKRPGRVKYGNITLRATPDSVFNIQECDSDDDDVIDTRLSAVLGSGGGGGGGGGQLRLEMDADNDLIADNTAVLRITPTTSGLAIKTKGTGAQRFSVGGDCDDGDAILHTDWDDDGDGIAERQVVQSATPTSARLAINSKGTSAKRLTAGGDCDDTDASLHTDCDDDNDGIVDREVTQTVTPTTAGVAIQTKGTGADHNRTASSTTTTTLGEVSSVAGLDDDGDGVTEQGIDQILTPVTSSVAIKTKGTGADKNRTASSTTTTTLGQVSMVTDIDDDGDTVPESQDERVCGPDSIVHTSEVSSGGSYATSNVRVRLDALESKLQSLGLLARTSSSQACDDTSASVASEMDLNNDGTVDVSSGLASSSTRSGLHGHFENGSTPNQDDFSVALDASGARIGLSIANSGQWSSSTASSCTPDSVTTTTEVTDYMEWSIHRAEHAKGGVSRMAQHHSAAGDDNTIDDDCDGISARTVWSNQSGGALSSLTIEASGAADPITHSSGAKLTTGGVWTNASDVNLKENFEPVDGEKILDKVESLPITEWNYKNESDEVKHIGPTAQDFQRVFGIGESDKTISTIDPSGIALAAVKQLSKQNRDLKAQSEELKEQNAKLQKRLDELSAKLDKLIQSK